MTLHENNLDQAARYLRYACELLERQAFGQKTVVLRDVLQQAVRRLSPAMDSSGTPRPDHCAAPESPTGCRSLMRARRS